MRRSTLTFCILQFALGIACSIPNLETQNCIEARNAVKQLYSFHFGNDMHSSPEYLKAREKFLTKELFVTLSEGPIGEIDYFTGSKVPPTTFNVGDCEDKDASTVVFHVQLYWRHEGRTDQKEIHVEAVKSDGTWLVNKVSN